MTTRRVDEHEWKSAFIPMSGMGKCGHSNSLEGVGRSLEGMVDFVVYLMYLMYFCFE